MDGSWFLHASSIPNWRKTYSYPKNDLAVLRIHSVWGTLKNQTCTPSSLLQYEKLTPYANFQALHQIRRVLFSKSWTSRVPLIYIPLFWSLLSFNSSQIREIKAWNWKQQNVIRIHLERGENKSYTQNYEKEKSSHKLPTNRPQTAHEA